MCVALLLSAAGHGAASGDPDPSFERRARELAALRGELERIGAELVAERETQRGRARSVAAHTQDLQLQVALQRSRLGALRRTQQEQAEREAEQRARQAALQPEVDRVLSALLGWVSGGLPFRPAERAAELEQVRARLLAGRLDPVAAATRAWHFLEDELTLAASCGLSRQVIEVEGREQLVEVARLGQALLYYRTPDGSFGHARRAGSAYRIEPLDDPADRRALTELFETFERGVLVGPFDVPVTGPQGPRP